MLSLFHPADNEAKATFADMGIDEETLKSIEIPVVDNAIPQLGRAFPVVIFSPGFGIDRDLYVEVITNVVQSGYVVVAVGVPYDSFLTVYPDGTFTAQADRHPSDVEQIELRTQDIQIVMQHLDEWNHDGCLHGLFDINRISVMGHSLGGSTALNVAISDQRIRCLVLLDASLHLIGNAVPPIPTLNIRQEAANYTEYLAVIRDEEEDTISESIAKAYIEKQIRLYEHLPPNKSFIKILGANHLSFSTVSRLIGAADLNVTLTIQNVISSFLDEFLKTKSGSYTEFIMGASKPSNVVEINGAGMPVGV